MVGDLLEVSQGYADLRKFGNSLLNLESKYVWVFGKVVEAARILQLSVPVWICSLARLCRGGVPTRKSGGMDVGCWIVEF